MYDTERFPLWLTKALSFFHSFLVLRDVVIADDGYKILQQHRQKALQRGTVYDMAVDVTCETVVTVGQVR